MKIAIYGDSFGSHYLRNTPGDETDRGLGWPEWLAEKYQVTNFALAGSSLFYSYELFLKHNKKFDYNIFLVTEPNRLTIPKESVRKDPRIPCHINLNLIDTMSRYNDTHRDLVTAVNLYYGLIHNPESVNTFHRLMLEDITRVNQNSLLIPCFYDSMPNSTFEHLCELTNMELRNHKLMQILSQNNYSSWTAINDENGTWTYADYRKCHLNKENNRILSILIDRAIKNNQQSVDLSVNQFTESTENIENYFLYVDLTKTYSERILNGELHNLCNKLSMAQN